MSRGTASGIESLVERLLDLESCVTHYREQRDFDATRTAEVRRDAVKDLVIERWAELLGGLKLAYDAIKSLPVDCMGDGSDGQLVWPIRDEVLDSLAKIIAKTDRGQQ